MELTQDICMSTKIQVSKVATSNRVDFAPNWEEDSDGEQIQLCVHCSLPLGHTSVTKDSAPQIIPAVAEFPYDSPSPKKLSGRPGGCLHAECIAQETVKEMRHDEDARLKK